MGHKTLVNLCFYIKIGSFHFLVRIYDMTELTFVFGGFSHLRYFKFVIVTVNFKCHYKSYSIINLSQKTSLAAIGDLSPGQ